MQGASECHAASVIQFRAQFWFHRRHSERDVPGYRPEPQIGREVDPLRQTVSGKLRYRFRQQRVDLGDFILGKQLRTVYDLKVLDVERQVFGQSAADDGQI